MSDSGSVPGNPTNPKLMVLELREGQEVDHVAAGIAHHLLTGHVGGGCGFDYQCEECGFEIADGVVVGAGSISVLAEVSCANHPDVAATHTAKMPSSERPYTKNVPLCPECARRIAAIGFPILEV